jgi:tetratricopeptide (TPR) repeat protein
LKKTLKKQMKQDELVTGFEKARHAMGAHIDEVKIAGVVIAVLVVGGLALHHFRSQRDLEAREAVGRAIQTFRATVTGEPNQLAPSSGPVFATAEEKYRKALGDFEGVERRYGSHDVALRARYYAALCKIELGQAADAETALKDIAAKRDGERLEPALARLALADLQRRSGQVNPAIESYKQMVDDPSFALPRDHALMGLAKLLDEARRPKEAQAFYRRLVDEFPESTYASEAKQRVDYLQAAG